MVVDATLVRSRFDSLTSRIDEPPSVRDQDTTGAAASAAAFPPSSPDKRKSETTPFRLPVTTQPPARVEIASIGDVLEVRSTTRAGSMLEEVVAAGLERSTSETVPSVCAARANFPRKTSLASDPSSPSSSFPSTTILLIGCCNVHDRALFEVETSQSRIVPSSEEERTKRPLWGPWGVGEARMCVEVTRFVWPLRVRGDEPS